MKYTVDWRGEPHEVDAESEQDALDRLVDEMRNDIQVNATVRQLKVYTVKFNYANTHANVLAYNETQAEDIGREHVENIKEELLNGLDMSQRAFVQDMRTDVEVLDWDTSGHYEINTDAEWDEGTL